MTTKRLAERWKYNPLQYRILDPSVQFLKVSGLVDLGHDGQPSNSERRKVEVEHSNE